MDLEMWQPIPGCYTLGTVGSKWERIYTISKRLDFLEIPYILTWTINDRYISYRASMQPNIACSSTDMQLSVMQH